MRPGRVAIAAAGPHASTTFTTLGCAALVQQAAPDGLGDQDERAPDFDAATSGAVDGDALPPIEDPEQELAAIGSGEAAQGGGVQDNLGLTAAFW